MSTDLTVYDARVTKLEAMLEALQKTRDDLAARLHGLEQDIAAVTQMHSGVERELVEARVARDRMTKSLPVESQAAIAGLRLLSGGGGT